MALWQDIKRGIGSTIEQAGYFTNMPELGISERFGVRTPRFSTYAAEPQVKGAQSIYKPNYSSNRNSQLQYTPTQSREVNTGSSGGSGNSGGSGDSFNYPEQNIRSPQQSGELDAINREFNAFNNYLSNQEQAARSNFDEAKGLYDTQKANAEQKYAGEKETQTTDIKKTEALNLKRVRQLLQDLQQGNAARTAITGGGSVSEALGERFGREAQARLGNVQTETARAIERVNTFYDNAITKLQESYDASILGARQQLQNNLDTINYNREQSAAAKQRNTVTAWRDYYNNVNQAKIQAATFKAQYDLWKQQQDSQLAATQGFNVANAGTYNTGLQSSFADVPQAPGVAQERDQFGGITNKYFNVQGNDDYDEKNWWETYLPGVINPTQAPDQPDLLQQQNKAYQGG